MLSDPHFRINSFFPIYNTGTAISYIAKSILDNMRTHGVSTQLWVPASRVGAQAPCIRNAIPRSLKGLSYRFLGSRNVLRYSQWKYLKALRQSDLAYVWPGEDSLNLSRRIKDRGIPLAIERINCQTRYARQLLAEDSSEFGIPSEVTISDEAIRDEEEEIRLADYLFAPSPLVAESFIQAGVPAEKVITCSYGWSRERIRSKDWDSRPGHTPQTGLRVLFVGLVCFRKGIHRLLDAWKEANIPGQLILAGDVTPHALELHRSDFSRPDIKLIGYQKNVSDLYASADLFVFPSLEEGSPLVTYEAMAAGLPMIVSPMGAGGVARHGEGALIVPPQDKAGWVNALQTLAADHELRVAMGRASALRAENFTWERCAIQRWELLKQKLK